MQTTKSLERIFQFHNKQVRTVQVEAENECEELRGVVADLLPKAEFYDRVADTNASFSLGETAKMLEIPCFGWKNSVTKSCSPGPAMWTTTG